MPMIGKTLGHFEILEKLGEGGMGVVYKARDAHLDRLVAIKILPADKVADSDRRRRFVQEAKTASALNHPNIVTIYDITQHEGIDFIAMELVPGRTLDRMIPRHVVFESLQSGTQELWVADRDGRDARQLTSLGGRRGGTPSWSPNGQSIAFDWRNEDGHGDIYVIPLRGGAPVRITNHPGAAEDLVPSWSRDGQWIYFGSTRTGEYQIWKVSFRGGQPVQLTQHRGTYAKESTDGRYLYYAKFGSTLPTLWRVPVHGGEEVEVLRDVAGYMNFAVTSSGIYFASLPPGNPVALIPMFSPLTRPEVRIEFLSFATGKRTLVITLDRYPGHGLDVSADGRTLLVGQTDSFTEDLMLVERFR
jgi:hypothetical protein